MSVSRPDILTFARFIEYRMLDLFHGGTRVEMKDGRGVAPSLLGINRGK